MCKNIFLEQYRLFEKYVDETLRIWKDNTNVVDRPTAERLHNTLLDTAYDLEQYAIPSDADGEIIYNKDTEEAIMTHRRLIGKMNELAASMFPGMDNDIRECQTGDSQFKIGATGPDNLYTFHLPDELPR